ncbi:hypothetical protein [uncultured Deefgea sp.]|uniref:hypothetical protein n=1 Tax=uncultured Deefgea sp. TaxID=1304914 RepID=UPI002613E86D|nr:hypothetical protein [uncultured Deefgea sp.]
MKINSHTANSLLASPIAMWPTSLDALKQMMKNAGLAFNHASSFDRLNEKAGQPLRSGFFTSERLERPCVPEHAIVAPSLVGRGGEAFGLAGLLFRQSVNPATFSPPPFDSGWRGFNPHEKGAFIMPKLARTFLTYSLLAITVIAFERNTPLIVVALSFAAFCLAHVIGGARHD